MPGRRNPPSILGRPFRPLAAGLCIATALLVGSIPAAGTTPAVTGGVSAALHVAPPVFTPRGGVATFQVSTDGATSCALASVPAFPAGSKRVACGRGVSTTIDFPPNAKSTAATYLVTLTAKRGASVATARSAVIVEGSHWQASGAPRAAPFMADSISCANPADCVITSYDGDAAHLTGSGATWTNPDNTLPSAPETGLASVSCVPGSKDFCVALDYSGNYLVFNGTSWTSPAPLYQSGGVTAKPWRIDCMGLPVASGGGEQCVAIDGTAHDAVYTATFQATTTVTATAVPLSGPGRIACATPVLCVAVDPRGRASVLSNGVWSTTATVLDPLGSILAVSCAPDHGCVATDQHDNVIDFSLRGGTVSGIVSHSVYSALGRNSVPRSASCVMFVLPGRARLGPVPARGQGSLVSDDLLGLHAARRQSRGCELRDPGEHRVVRLDVHGRAGVVQDGHLPPHDGGGFGAPGSLTCTAGRRKPGGGGLCQGCRRSSVWARALVKPQCSRGRSLVMCATSHEVTRPGLYPRCRGRTQASVTPSSPGPPRRWLPVGAVLGVALAVAVGLGISLEGAPRHLGHRATSAAVGTVAGELRFQAGLDVTWRPMHGVVLLRTLGVGSSLRLGVPRSGRFRARLRAGSWIATGQSPMFTVNGHEATCTAPTSTIRVVPATTTTVFVECIGS